MTVIPFPRSQGRPLFLFSQRPEWPHATEQFYDEWFHNCRVNTAVALLTARKTGMAVAHAVPSRGCDRSTDLLWPGSGLRIHRHESVFTLTYPSLFRNELLREFLERTGLSRIFLIGFPVNDVALASAIDARRYGYRLTIMRDCSPLVALQGISVGAADRVMFGSVAAFAQVENVGDHLSRLLPDRECSAGEGCDSPAMEDDTLRFLLGHLAEQAESLGQQACARKIRQAASCILPQVAATGDLRSDR